MFGLAGLKLKLAIAGVVGLVLAGMYAVIWFQGNKIDGLLKDVGMYQQREQQFEQTIINLQEVNNNNIEKFQAEILQQKESLNRYVVQMEDISNRLSMARNEAEEYRLKYQDGRLARLSEIKGGLLTRMAKTGAEKRNAEWQNVIE